jgi:drug/metabolite transporter (DMT)-like permease
MLSPGTEAGSRALIDIRRRGTTGTLPDGGTTPLLVQLLSCSFLWASAFLLMKLVGADVTPVALAAVRGVMGASLLGAWLVARGERILPRGREWRDWAVLGMLQGAIPNTLTAYALSQITTGLTSLIQASSPLMVAVLAHVLFADERLTGRRVAGVLVGFAGMAILIGPAAFAGGGGSLEGTLAMLATAASYALGTLYVRSIPDARPARLALGQQAFSALPTLAWVLAATGPGAFAGVPAHLPALAALGLFGTALPIVLYMRILRYAGPTLGAMNGYLVPFWTLLLGMALLDEPIGLREIAGGLVVLAGVGLVSAARRARLSPSRP